MPVRSVPTSITLLERLRLPTDEEAWSRFVLLYTPLILSWARGVKCSPEQAEELLQEVFVVLLQKLPTFEYRPDDRFQGWLHEVTRNKWLELRRDKWRTVLLQGEDLDAIATRPDGNPFEEREFRAFVTQRMLDLIATDFAETTSNAFQEYVVKGRPAQEVAQELGISQDVVYSAKSRVLRRLRAELSVKIE